MRVSIFGLGYVGAVTAACLARDGHQVVGVDVNPDKVALVSSGCSPIIEPGLDELLRQSCSAGRITATVSADDAVANSDVSLISVGTPKTSTGEPDLLQVDRVCRELGAAIAAKDAPHVVVLRSTVPPGTVENCAKLLGDVCEPYLVHVAFSPEFLREGSAIADFNNPALTVIGTDDATAEHAIRELFASVDAPVVVVKPAVAEMVKYVANAWHATKIAFANETGRLSKAFGVDGREVMDLIVRDAKLNTSPAYLRPGFAFGGSCLPKDVRALLHHATRLGVESPLLSAVFQTNQSHIDAAVDLILRDGPRRVVVLGLAFKCGTDDLRESPAVTLVKRLVGEGCAVDIYDQAVRRAHLMGTNLAYIRANIPHIERMLVDDPASAIAQADLVVATYACPDFQDLVIAAPEGTRFIDLAGLFSEPPPHLESDGIAW